MLAMSFIIDWTVRMAKIDYTPASRLLMIANSPLFLFEQLQQTHTVHALAASHSPRVLLTLLRTALSRTPTTNLARVKPYALLAALVLRGDVNAVKTAMSFRSEHYPWYISMAAISYEISKSTTRVSKSVFNVVNSPKMFDDPTASATTYKAL